MEKIQAELKEAETKQRSLSKAYECVHAQATALIIFAVQWKDLEEHFESTRYSLELQLRELARRETAVQVRYGELEAKEMKFNSEIESKADELGGLQRLIDEKVEDVIQNKNHLHSLQSLIQECSNEVVVQETRLMEAEGFVVEKKRECDSIERRVERRQKKLDWVERRVEEKLKVAEEKSKLAEVKAEEARGFEEALEKCVEEIELKKRELNEIRGLIEKRKEEFNSIGEQIMGAEELMKVQEEQLGFKEERIKEAQRAVEQCDKELKWREKLITEAERAVEECDKELKLKKEKLVVIDKSLVECSNALESREKKIREIDSKKDKDLCLREKSLEEWSCKLEFKEMEVRLGERIVELKAGELQKLKEGERCLESVSQVLKQKENRLQDLDEELELKQKELDLIKKSTEERAKNLELKERQLEDQTKELELKQKGFDSIKKFSEERTQNLKSKENTSILLSHVKIEQFEHIPANNVVVPSTSSNQSSVNMDGRGLLLFINEHLKTYVLLGSEISAALQASPDPAKLVLDAMQGFYHANSSADKSECDFDLRITRMTCSLLLENLKSVSPQINPEVREEAIKLAGDWKVKMRTDNCLEVLGFLRLVSTYGITSFYDAKELQSLCAIVAKDEHTTELSWAFGMTGEAPAKIEAPESLPAKNAETRSSPNLQLTATRDASATHLQGFLNELFSRDRLTQTETWAAFQSSSEPEPEKFVMDVMQTSFDKYSKIEDAGFKEIVMANYISLLNMLMRIKPHVGHHVNKDALKLAINWKLKIGASTQPLELLGFLQFIATYGLLSMFNRETLVLLGRISQQKQALEICQTLGLADKIPEIIRGLIEKKQLIEAVRLICPFKLIEKFPPAPLLEEFVENAKLLCIQMSKRHKLFSERDKCVNDQIAALRVVIQCIKDCNLESEYPSRFIETRIALLENMKKNRRRQMTSPPSKVEQQGKKNSRVSKVEGQEQKQSPASEVEGREQKKSPSPRVEGREHIKPLASNVEQGAEKPFASTVEGQEQKRSVPSQAEPEEHRRGKKRQPNTLPRRIQPPQQRRNMYNQTSASPGTSYSSPLITPGYRKPGPLPGENFQSHAES
ncbi:FRIGIDA-like protein 5 isoform X1 [Pyrus communis]|uniref:FRIGIDA-like protein 5 isoform X1 n=1 Tax=Pyrus communis TaxID=23211 RepID=UPI0035C1633B